MEHQTDHFTNTFKIEKKKELFRTAACTACRHVCLRTDRIQPDSYRKCKTMICFDTVRRYLEYKGYDVNYVSNFTDVDDKIIEESD